MLKLFKTNLAFIPVILILCIIVFLRIDVFVSDFQVFSWSIELAPFSKLFSFLFKENILHNKAFNLLFSGLLVLLQSGIILSIVANYKSQINSFLPAWVFILLIHLFPAYTYLSPQLLSFTFILLSVRTLVLYVNSKSIKQLFETGIYLGVAAMFWLPSIFLFLVFIYLLNKHLLLTLKAIVSILFTCSIPVLYAVVYYYYLNDDLILSSVFNTLKLNNFDFKLKSLSKLLSSLVTFILFMLSIFSLLQNFDKELKDFKVFIIFLFLLVLNVLVMFLFQNENSIWVLMFLYFPVSVYISLFFNRIKRKPLAEFIHLVLLLTIIINFMYFT